MRKSADAGKDQTYDWCAPTALLSLEGIRSSLIAKRSDPRNDDR